jgi:hypothetical protein
MVEISILTLALEILIMPNEASSVANILAYTFNKYESSGKLVYESIF